MVVWVLLAVAYRTLTHSGMTESESYHPNLHFNPGFTVQNAVELKLMPNKGHDQPKRFVCTHYNAQPATKYFSSPGSTRDHPYSPSYPTRRFLRIALVILTLSIMIPS